MVDKNMCNDVAILFDVVVDKGDTFDVVEAFPCKIIEGYYDPNECMFLSKDNVVFHHILDGVMGYSYGLRKSFAELFSLFPDANYDLKVAKSEYLKSIKKLKFYIDIDTDDFSRRISVYDESTKKSYFYKDADSDNLDDFASLMLESEVSEENADDSSKLPSTNEEASTKDTKPIRLDINSLRDELYKVVIGQKEAHKRILNTVWENYHSDVSKSKNILILGPSGVGKTETFRTIANYINVPIVIEDCNEFTMTGYVGRDVKEILSDLLRKANNDVNLAQKGIVVLDEIDKIASVSSHEVVATSGVQDALLTMLDGGKFTYHTKDDKVVEIDTSGITFVGLGAFSNINNLTPPKVGFGSQNITKTYDEVGIDEIKKYGIKDEFVGRFPVNIKMHELDVEDLKNILLYSSKSPLLDKYNLYKSEGINFIYSEDFVLEAARLAKKLKIGARGLFNIIENSLYEAQAEIIFSNDKYSSLTVSKDTVNDPKKYILR